MKTRSIVRTRQVPHTINGETRMVKKSYAETVPAPPWDWDRIILGVASSVAGAALLASVAWSTASVGELLNRAAPAGAAYAAAGTFDIAWIVAGAMEWLARYAGARHRVGGVLDSGPDGSGQDRTGVRIVRTDTGHRSGRQLVGGAQRRGESPRPDDLPVGRGQRLLGACLGTPLVDPLLRQVVEGLGVVAQDQRPHALRQGGHDSGDHGHGPTAGQPAVHADRDHGDDERDVPGSARDAGFLRVAEDIADQLSAAGIPVSAATVRTVLAEPEPVPDPRPLRAVSAPSSISDIVRAELADGDPGESAVSAAVRRVHPDAKTDTVGRLYRRHRPAS